jgi:hypothetical protein
MRLIIEARVEGGEARATDARVVAVVERKDLSRRVKKSCHNFANKVVTFRRRVAGESIKSRDINGLQQAKQSCHWRGTALVSTTDRNVAVRAPDLGSIA